MDGLCVIYTTAGKDMRDGRCGINNIIQNEVLLILCF
jgi:hypothetical protein